MDGGPGAERADSGRSSAGRPGSSGGSRGAICAAGARRSVASLNTVISTGGVAVGVMALIVVLGVMNGLRNDLRERILVANPHLRILTFGAGLRMDDWRKVLRDRPPPARRGGGRARGDQPGGDHGGRRTTARA